MKIAETFSKSEDAYVAASLLSSEGLDPTVIEDSAYGGNVMGAIANAIRIEVPDHQFEAAQKILRERR